MKEPAVNWGSVYKTPRGVSGDEKRSQRLESGWGHVDRRDDPEGPLCKDTSEKKEDGRALYTFKFYREVIQQMTLKRKPQLFRRENRSFYCVLKQC